MKILLLSQYAGSRKHGMVLRNYNWALELTRFGHEVTVLAAAFSHTRINQPEKKHKVATEEIDGIRYIWLKDLIKYSPKKTLGRILSMFSFTWTSWRFLKKHTEEYDLVIASSPQPFIIYAAKAFAKKQKAKLVFDVRDLWPLTLMELSSTGKYNPLIWLMQKAEDYACRHSDLICAVPGNCESYLQDHGLEKGRFLHIPNGLASSTQEQQPLPEQHQKLLKSLKDKGYLLLGYTGTCGTANAMDCCVEALSKAQDRLHCVIVGRAPCQEELEKLSNDLGVSHRLHFLPSLSSEQVPSFLSNIDIAYAGTQYKELYRYGASLTKINDYMNASKPIIYAVGDPNNAVEQSEGGFSCKAENIQEIASIMNALCNMDADQRDKIGQKGRKWLYENNLVSISMKRLLDHDRIKL